MLCWQPIQKIIDINVCWCHDAPHYDCRTMANMSAINERWNIWIRSVDLSRELRPEICEDPQVRFPVSVATTGGYAEDEGPSGRCCVVESRILSMGR